MPAECSHRLTVAGIKKRRWTLNGPMRWPLGPALFWLKRHRTLFQICWTLSTRQATSQVSDKYQCVGEVASSDLNAIMTLTSIVAVLRILHLQEMPLGTQYGPALL